MGGPVISTAGTNFWSLYHFDNFAFDGVCMFMCKYVPGRCIPWSWRKQTIFGQSAKY